uniref:Uncharacterized protein n=1 Tax=Romanomermis culicivorax TaxID=13658 RepID=A0A915HIS5_ROMCU
MIDAAIQQKCVQQGKDNHLDIQIIKRAKHADFHITVCTVDYSFPHISWSSYSLFFLSNYQCRQNRLRKDLRFFGFFLYLDTFEKKNVGGTYRYLAKRKIAKKAAQKCKFVKKSKMVKKCNFAEKAVEKLCKMVESAEKCRNCRESGLDIGTTQDDWNDVLLVSLAFIRLVNKKGPAGMNLSNYVAKTQQPSATEVGTQATSTFLDANLWLAMDCNIICQFTPESPLFDYHSKLAGKEQVYIHRIFSKAIDQYSSSANRR